MSSYLETHPWISFDYARWLKSDMQRFWMLMGEARSKCEHVSGTPLMPKTAEELNVVWLAKGVHATTSIEGNTLSEAEVRSIARQEGRVPRSRDYLRQEVENMLSVFHETLAAADAGDAALLTPAGICAINGRVLKGLLVDELTEPGTFRHHSVGIEGARYRGAPAEEVPDLVRRLCEWLEGPSFQHSSVEGRFAMVFIKAVLAHLYLAWIHPFGDGNGRTARMLEFQILARSGMMPFLSAHLLSDHYNRTRSEYYRQLDLASRSGGNVAPFLEYALLGFVDGIREQLETVREQQLRVTWEHLVHDWLPDHGSPSEQRRRFLVLDMPPAQDLRRTELREVSTRVARAYGSRGDKALSRDLNILVEKGLLLRTKTSHYRVNRSLIMAFLPR